MAAGRAEEFVFFHSKHKEPDSDARRKASAQSSDPAEPEVRHKQPERTWKQLGFKCAVSKAGQSVVFFWGGGGCSGLHHCMSN